LTELEEIIGMKKNETHHGEEKVERKNREEREPF